MRLLALFAQVGTTAALGLAIACSGQVYSAQAISLVAGSSALDANDQLDWSSLGPAQPFNVLPNTFTATSTGGIGLTVSISPTTIPGVTPPLVFQTAPSPAGIPTNFAAGDFILLTGLTPGVSPPLAILDPLISHLAVLFLDPVHKSQ
jgi:hypothetical protein